MVWPFIEEVCQLLVQMSQRRQWQPTPVLLAWKIPGTEVPGRLQTMGSLRVGHPLQYSCLENPRDRGA